MDDVQTYEFYDQVIKNIKKNGEERKQKYLNSYSEIKKMAKRDFIYSAIGTVESVSFGVVSYLSYGKNMKYNTIFCGVLAIAFAILSYYPFVRAIKDGKKMKLDKQNMILIDEETSKEVEDFQKTYTKNIAEKKMI